MLKSPDFDLDPHIYSATLAPEPSSVALARLTVMAALWDWRIGHLADTAQLIVSELATNAIKFANTVTIYVFILGDRGGLGNGDTLAIEVIDDSPVMPAIVDADVDDESHRGLMLVDALATKWGVDHLDPGKTVWAHLRYDDF
jgi:anti-sigma regulatory factor (Ser/Thr protein kinase)